MEVLTYPQIVTATIALVAIIISLVSLRRTSRVQEQQLRLHKKQEELTDLQLESLRRQSQTPSLAAAPAQMREKADVRVDLQRVGSDFKFFITNWGRVPARDVTFELDVEASKSPLIRDDYNEKIPIPELAPGNRVPLWAAITMGWARLFPLVGVGVTLTTLLNRGSHCLLYSSAAGPTKRWSRRAHSR